VPVVLSLGADDMVDIVGGSIRVCVGLDVLFSGSDSGLGLCTHGFSFGILGVVYGDRAASERSHFFGAQTPMRTRQAAIKRLALRMQRGRRLFSVTRKKEKQHTLHNWLGMGELMNVCS